MSSLGKLQEWINSSIHEVINSNGFTAKVAQEVIPMSIGNSQSLTKCIADDVNARLVDNPYFIKKVADQTIESLLEKLPEDENIMQSIGAVIISHIEPKMELVLKEERERVSAEYKEAIMELLPDYFERFIKRSSKRKNRKKQSAW